MVYYVRLGYVVSVSLLDSEVILLIFSQSYAGAVRSSEFFQILKKNSKMPSLGERSESREGHFGIFF